MRLILTQPAPRVQQIAHRLLAQGHQVIEFPQQQLLSLLDDASIAILTRQITASDWIIPVSPFAIQLLRHSLTVPRWPARVAVAFIGPGSQQAWLREFDGVLPTQFAMPTGEPYEGFALLTIPAFVKCAGLRVAVLRSESKSGQDSAANRWIAQLRQMGAQVTEIALYRSQLLPAAPDTIAQVLHWCLELNTASAPAFVVTSVAAARHLSEWAQPLPQAQFVLATKVLATHQRIVAALVASSWNKVRLIEPGEASLLSELESRS